LIPYAGCAGRLLSRYYTVNRLVFLSCVIIVIIGSLTRFACLAYNIYAYTYTGVMIKKKKFPFRRVKVPDKHVITCTSAIENERTLKMWKKKYYRRKTYYYMSNNIKYKFVHLTCSLPLEMSIFHSHLSKPNSLRNQMI